MNKRLTFPNSVTLITIAGVVIRLVSLNQSLWLDEAISVNIAKQYSYLGIILDFAKSDFHPPLFYEVLKFWTSVFGHSEITARSLSILFGVLTIPLIYLITKRLASHRAGLIAATFFAVAPLDIYYSQEARMYAMETFLVAASVYLFLRLVDRYRNTIIPDSDLESPDDSVRASRSAMLSTFQRNQWQVPAGVYPRLRSGAGMTLSVFTIVNIAIIYTDYLPAFIFVFYLVWMIWNRRSLSRQFFIQLVASFAITALAFIPFVPIFLQQLHLGQASTQTSWSHVLGVVSIKSLALVIIKFLIGRISFHPKIIYAAYVGINIVAVGLDVAFGLRKSRRSWFALGWLVIPLLLGIVFGLKLSIFDYFRFLFVLPAMSILTAIGIDRISSRNMHCGLLCAILILELISSSIYLTQKQFQREDWRSAVAYIQSRSQQPAETIFVNPAQADAYLYYSNGSVPVGGSTAVFDQSHTIWLMRYVQDIFDPTDSVRQHIESLGYKKAANLNFNGVVVWEYKK